MSATSRFVPRARAISPQSPRFTVTTSCTALHPSRRFRPSPTNSRPGAAISSRGACRIWSPSGRDACVGYCYASRYGTRSAYRFTVEELDLHRPGGGRARHRPSPSRGPLLDRCAELGYRQMVAVIGGSDTMAVDPPARGARLHQDRPPAGGRLQIRRVGRHRLDAACPRPRRNGSAGRGRFGK